MTPRTEDLLLTHLMFTYVKDNDVKNLKILFEENPSLNCNIKNVKENTPLIEAAMNDHHDIVRILLDAKANPDILDNSGESPLGWAAYNENAKSVQALLEKKPNINSKNKLGNTPLMEVIQQRTAIVQLKRLKDNADIQYRYYDWHATPALLDGRSSKTVHCSIQADKYQAQSKKLEEKINQLETKEASADEVIRLLLNENADPNILNHEKETALSIAISNKDSVSIKTLLEAKSDPNLRIKNSSTVLHLTIKFPQLTQILLDAKADPNLQNNSGNSPLHLAAQRHDAEPVKKLLNAKADLHLKNNEGKTPFDISPCSKLRKLLNTNSKNGRVYRFLGVQQAEAKKEHKEPVKLHLLKKG